MSDEELIARLRRGLIGVDVDRRAADRIEALSAERDRWKDACRSASRDLNIVVPDNDRLKSERDAAEAKLPKAVEALKSLHHAVCGETGFASAVRNHSGKAYPWEPLDIADAQTRAVLAELEGK